MTGRGEEGRAQRRPVYARDFKRSVLQQDNAIQQVWTGVGRLSIPLSHTRVTLHVRIPVNKEPTTSSDLRDTDLLSSALANHVNRRRLGLRLIERGDRLGNPWVFG